MATESVTSTNDPNRPWGPLLKDVPQYVDANGNVASSLTADELKRIERAAGEMIRLIIDGFSAIGELQWRAAAFDNGSIDADVFGMLAPLQVQLAELVVMLRATESNAAYYQRKLAAGGES
jgi:hypothetical protein